MTEKTKAKIGLAACMVGILSLCMGCQAFYPKDSENSIEVSRGAFGAKAVVRQQADTKMDSQGFRTEYDEKGNVKSIQVMPFNYNATPSVNQAAQAVKMERYNDQIQSDWAGINENARIWAPIVGQGIAQLGPITSTIAGARVAMTGIKAAVSPGAVLRAGSEVLGAFASGAANPAVSMPALRQQLPEVADWVIKARPDLAAYGEPIFVPAATQPANGN